MKSIATAAALALAGTAIPAECITAPLSAQDTAQAPTIVVSAKYQKDWTKGSKLEAAGLKDLEKANKDLVRYSADVVDAQNKRAGSNAQAGNASAEFRRLTTNIAYFSDAKDAERWAKQVEKAASQWAKQDGRSDAGASDFDKAVKNQRKAQDAVNKAQQQVDRGRSMKADAERLSTMGGE